MNEEPHIFQCLTQDEFLTCWALRMTLGFESFEDAYPLDAHGTPGGPDIADTYEEEIRRAIRYLALDHGLVFEGLAVAEEGSIRGVPVEPRNIAYVRGIAAGAFPNPLQAIETALRFLGERAASVSTDPLRQLRSDLEMAVKMAPPPDRESYLETKREEAEALAGVGAFLSVSGEVH